jgi:hypothetical protein
MKRLVENYTYNKTTGVITLTGVNIDRDQLLLIVNTTRNVIYYNFADSATKLQTFTQGANTSITLASSVVSASSTHANADALTIYYDDQGNITANIGYAGSYDNGGDSIKIDLSAVRGQDSALFLREGGGNVPISGTVTANLDSTSFVNAVIANNANGDPLAVTANVLAGNTEAIVARQILVGAHGDDFNSGTGRVAVDLVDNVGNSIVQQGNLPIQGTVTASNSEWVLLGTRDWNAITSPWEFFGLNQYSSIRLELGGGGYSEIIAYEASYSYDRFWFWDGDSRMPGFQTLTFIGNSYTAPVQYDYIRFSIVVESPSDPCVAKLYAKKNFTNLGLTNQQLRENPLPISGTVTATDLGVKADAVATTDTGTFSVIALIKRGLQNWTSLLAKIPTLVSGRIPVDGSGVTQPVSGPLTDTQLRATAVPVSGTVTTNAGTGTFNISDKGSTGESNVTSFTSTSSAVLKASNSNRKLLTIFNEGNGTLFILLGSGTASTSNYSFRLLGGDYYELEKYTGELNAIFASSGTAKVTEIT